MLTSLFDEMIDPLSDSLKRIEETINYTLELDTPCRIENVVKCNNNSNSKRDCNEPYWRKWEDELYDGVNS